MRVDKEIAYIKKQFPQLLNRQSALGKDAHMHLLELEENWDELYKLKGGKMKSFRKDKRPKKRAVLYICLYCGVRGEGKDFPPAHNKECDRPIVQNIARMKRPSKVKIFTFYEIRFWRGKYRFKTKESALAFRNSIVKDKMPLKVAVFDKNLEWHSGHPPTSFDTRRKKGE